MYGGRSAPEDEWKEAAFDPNSKFDEGDECDVRAERGPPGVLDNGNIEVSKFLGCVIGWYCPDELAANPGVEVLDWPTLYAFSLEDENA